MEKKSNSMKYKRIKGTRDILPEESWKWQYLEQFITKILEQNNYNLVRTPVFEMTDLFTRSIGEETDVVSKEMYSFTDKSGKNLTLRPELTAPVIRMYIQNNLNQISPVIKLFYIDSLFRQERPQKGRYRQFHQFGFEIIGTPHPESDAEVIQTMVAIYTKLGIRDLKVKLNSIGSRDSRNKYLETLQSALEQHKTKFCSTCQDRMEKNILRLFDCKSQSCQDLLDEFAPPIIDSLSVEDREHFTQVQNFLKISGVDFEVDKKLVRGLDYYTRTTFEITSSLLGAQDAICGGGRYDHLVEDLGGQPTPAVGVACGMERLMLILDQIDTIPARKNKLVYFAVLGENAREKAFEILCKIRNRGVTAEMDFMRRSLKSQMRNAGKKEAHLVAIIGDNEIEENRIILKNMKLGKQQEVTVENIINEILKQLNEVEV